MNIMNIAIVERVRDGRLALALVCLLGMNISVLADALRAGSSDLSEVTCHVHQVQPS